MDVPLPPTGRQLTRELRNYKLNAYKTFLRSDHSSFWYPHALKDQSIAAILLTDLGPWRRRVATRYHSSADNTKLLTKQNLLFLKNSIDSLMKTMLDLGEGTCVPPVANSLEAATAAWAQCLEEQIDQKSVLNVVSSTTVLSVHLSNCMAHCGQWVSYFSVVKGCATAVYCFLSFLTLSSLTMFPRFVCPIKNAFPL